MDRNDTAWQDQGVCLWFYGGTEPPDDAAAAAPDHGAVERWPGLDNRDRGRAELRATNLAQGAADEP